MQTELGVRTLVKKDSKPSLNTEVFVDTVRKLIHLNDQLFKYIRECRSDLVICRYSDENEDFAWVCSKPELQDHWIERYLALSRMEPLRAEDRLSLINTLPSCFNLFEAYKAQAYYKAALQEMKNNHVDNAETFLLDAMNNGSMKALRWYLNAVISQKYAHPFFERSEATLIEIGNFARNFAQTRLYGSMAYLIWAEAVAHAVLLNPKSERTPQRCKAMRMLVGIAASLAEDQKIAAADACMRSFLMGESGLFSKNTLGIHSFEEIHKKIDELESSSIEENSSTLGC